MIKDSRLLWLLLLTLASGQEAEPAHNETQSEVRFLEEPQDSQVLLGDSVSLGCRPAAEGKMFWMRDQVFLGENEIISSFADRYSLPFYPATNDSQLNYSLHIVNASLADDANFKCQTISQTGTGPPSPSLGESRQAKLSVLRPPSRLQLSVISTHRRPSDSQDQMQVQDLAELEGQQQQDETPISLVVRHNDSLRLECRTDSAKPHAQLTWLDKRQRRVPDDPTADETLGFVSERLQPDPDEPRWTQTVLTWTLTVQHQIHTDQLFTCEASHATFEQPDRWPQLAGKRLRRQIKLDVQYEPEINLTQSEPRPREGSPLTLDCAASARPNQLQYSWFIDDQQVINASQRQLHFQRVTRQLHNRLVRCQVRNSLGESSSVLRLEIHYDPAFIGHLLPPSLQTDPLAAELSMAGEPSVSQQPLRRAAALRWPSEREFALARQLALSYEPGQLVRLRCDFDSNPKPDLITWFKIPTDYAELRNQTSAQTDQLTHSGALGLQLKPVGSPLDYQNMMMSLEDLEEPKKSFKRHIVNQPAKITQTELGADQIDFERMSEDLLDELRDYDAQLQARAAAQKAAGESPDLPAKLEPLHKDRPTKHDNWPIVEPLAWTLVESPTGSPNSSLSVGQKLQLTNKEPQQLGHRLASMSSSLLELKSDENTAGKYVCVTQDLADVELPSDSQLARAIYLVKRDRPRIISHRFQQAPIGSRRLQLECLVQVNLVVDNVTTISWFRNGKLIEPTGTKRVDQLSSKLLTGQPAKRIHISVERSPDFLFARSTLTIENADYHDFGQYNCTVINSLEKLDFLPIELKATSQTGSLFALLAWLAVGIVVMLICVASFVIVLGPPRKPAKLAPARLAGLNDKKLREEDTRTQTDDQSVDNRKSPPSQTAADNQINIQLTQHCDSRLNYDTNAMHQYGPNRPAARPPQSAKYAAICESLESKLHLGQPIFVAPGEPPQSFSTEPDPPLQPSVINRLLGRLMGGQQDPASRRATKSRPIISGPSLRRSSFSTSLSQLTDAPLSHQAPPSSQDSQAGSHLVSSKANLIQDSTTASDGSSGRSSSNSHQNPTGGHLMMISAEHQSLLQQQQQLYQPPQPVTAQHYMQQSMWSSPHQVSSADCASLYANQTYQSNQEHLHYQTLNGSLPVGKLGSVQTTDGYTNQLSGWTDHSNQSAPLNHYQLPPQILTTEAAYYSATQSRPCYATVCTKPFAAGSYATLPMRSLDNLDQSYLGPIPMGVPTTDDQSQYESRYGTMLSTAYKTLRYDTQTMQFPSAPAGNQDSTSSSPNSLVTHTNNSISHELHLNQQQLTESDQTARTAAAVVQADGSTSTLVNGQAPPGIGNGLATHV